MTQPSKQSVAVAKEQPDSSPTVQRSTVRQFGLALTLAFAITSGLTLLWATTTAGSIGGGIALLRGDSLYATLSGPVNLDAKSGVGSATVDFQNLSGQALRIVGFNNPCPCFSAKPIPLELPPHERKSIAIEIDGTRACSEDLTIYFLSDCTSQPRLSLQVIVKRLRKLPK